MINKNIFKAYDIRGIYPDELNEAAAYKIARAFAKFTNAKKVAIGYDMRASSKALHKAMVKGLIDIGVDVYDLGLVPTPVLYFAPSHLKLNGGIIISPSHNPLDYAGMKFVDGKSAPIYKENGLLKIAELAIEEDAGITKVMPKEKGECKEKDITDDYVQFIKDNLKAKKSFKIVIDTMHGAMGPFIKEIFKRSNQDITFISTEPDENIPGYNTPNPLLQENRKKIMAEMKKTKADFGVMFDGDADRMCIVDKKGGLVNQSFIAALLAREVLSEQKGATVIGDIRASIAVKDVAEENGGKYMIAKAGNPYVKDMMRQKDADFGFETSGHSFFKKSFYNEGSDLALVYLINAFSKSDKTPQEIFDELKGKYIIEKEANYKVTKENILDLIEEQYKRNEIVKIDGLSVFSPNFRFNIRKSNTEPLIRLNIEANSKESLEKEKEKLEEFLIQNGCIIDVH